MTKLTAQAAGTFAIAPTPFHDDGRIDEKSIDRLTDFYAEVGCDGVTVLGILGEAPKLDAAEAEQVAVRFVKRAKNMQIIVGVSAPGFAIDALAGEGVDGCGRRRRHDRAAAAPAHRRPDHGLFQAGAGSDRRRHSLGAAGLSADAQRHLHAGRDPQDRDGLAVLRDAQARGLAGPGKDLDAARLSRRTARCGRCRFWSAMAGCSSISKWSAAPTAP